MARTLSDLAELGDLRLAEVAAVIVDKLVASGADRALAEDKIVVMAEIAHLSGHVRGVAEAREMSAGLKV